MKPIISIFLTLAFTSLSGQIQPASPGNSNLSPGIDADQTYFQSTIDLLSLNPPYVSGAQYHPLIDLHISQEIDVRGFNNQWCLYASVSTTSNTTTTIQAVLGSFRPPNAIDSYHTITSLLLSSTPQPFISGSGRLNSCMISYFLVDAGLPSSLSEDFEVYYSVENGACPR